MAVKHTPVARFDDIPGSLPDGKVPENDDLNKIADTAVQWLNELEEDHLAANLIWRDILAFTDTFRTFHSIGRVCQTLRGLSDAIKRSNFQRTESEPHIHHSVNCSWLDINFIFTVQHGRLSGNCAGIVSVTQESSGEWRIWMLRTWLENYEGFGNPDEPAREASQAHAESNGAGEHVYDVIFVGGGQSGLGGAGRSKALGLDYILFDERSAIGDSWGDRYDSLKWHTIREHGNLPFGRSFPGEDTLLPKHRIAVGYKKWSQDFDINAQEGTRVNNALWDEAAEIWTVKTSGSFGDQAWKSKNVVLCIGPGHKNPVVPDWATEEKIKASGFKGTIMHSLNFRNAKQWAGRRGIVVGTANTAHDVAEDMADMKMHTTILQRGSTFIFPGEWLVHMQSANYNLDKPTAVSDREHHTTPTKINREAANAGAWSMIKKNAKRFDDLEAAGFKVDRYGDLFDHLYNRFGGHYVDIGSCARIVEGEIKVQTSPVNGLTQDGILLQNGTEVGADLIVLATGFNHDFRKDAAEIVGPQVAEQMDDYWGVDKEGEPRGYARLSGHPHLFYFGGETSTARFWSRFLALQLQRLKLGEPLKPYLEGK